MERLRTIVRRFILIREWLKLFIKWLWMWFLEVILGYGERPFRVIGWAASLVFGLALIYFLLRGVTPYTFTGQAFLGSLYYSSVSFTALGYGPWFSPTSVRPWVQGVGAFESFVGILMIVLFSITFTTKMRR